MSTYYRESPTREIVEMPFALARDLAEVPGSTWEFACNACIEEGVLCAECRSTAAAQAQPPRPRRLRLRFWRKERSA